MITCKEDLIGKVIRIRSKEDADLVTQVCARFGIYVGEWQGCAYVPLKSVAAKISHNHGNTYSCKLIFTDSYEEKSETAEEFKGLSDLTLSDLKPRTKVEYEKCKHKSAWEVIKEHEESGNLFICEHADDEVFNSDYPVCGYDMACIKDAILSETIYRKVERPVEWWEDAAEYIRSLNGEANTIRLTASEFAINVSVCLDERQARDLARILLEQEYENKNNASS